MEDFNSAKTYIYSWILPPWSFWLVCSEDIHPDKLNLIILWDIGLRRNCETGKALWELFLGELKTSKCFLVPSDF